MKHDFDRGLSESDPLPVESRNFKATSTPGADIGATLAWNVSTGSTANVIGVVDTGVDYTHPDLVWTRSVRRATSYKAGPVGAPHAWRRAGVKSTDR